MIIICAYRSWLVLPLAVLSINKITIYLPPATECLCDYVTIVDMISLLAQGAMTFVSFVDVPTYLHFAREKDGVVIKKLFSFWWPKGRNLMVPLK